MMNIDATFEMARARQADLRLLAGPQPMIPLTEPPFDSLRRHIGRLVARITAWSGTPRASIAPTDPHAPMP